MKIDGIFTVGDTVERKAKETSYAFPGVIIEILKTTKGGAPIVVECTVPRVAGCIHIFSPSQIQHRMAEVMDTKAVNAVNKKRGEA